MYLRLKGKLKVRKTFNKIGVQKIIIKTSLLFQIMLINKRNKKILNK
jgi:hypothetical protein